jgi:dissimilatory sulfite reductase related protein
VANRLRRLLDRDAAEITVIDSDDDHVYQPGLLFVPFRPGNASRREAPAACRFPGTVTIIAIRRAFMPTVAYAGTEVTVNDEGFFTDPGQWREEMAPQIAAAEGIAELTERHWQVIKFMRHEYEAKGSGPTVRVLGKTSGVTVKELYQLFPKGPAKLAAKIAGIPKPRGCI